MKWTETRWCCITERRCSMNLIISFSGRPEGNCDRIAQFIASETDTVTYFRDLNVHACSQCLYECFSGECKYRSDDVYGLYEQMKRYEKVILIVPMYCGNPSSLYFLFSERSQDYFMHNDAYDETIRRLYIIGVYGASESSPDFIPCLEKWFDGSSYKRRVLGIERHLYGQTLHDNILSAEGISSKILDFICQ